MPLGSVTKIASRSSNSRRPTYFFPSAREGFAAYMKALGVTAASKILLPAYIGWSSREGSGVYDPIQEIGAAPVFYRMSERLEIDVEDAKQQIVRHRPRLLLLIHYFGFPDKNAMVLADFARSMDVVVLEDEAHAMLSDIVCGACGRWGDAAIYSFHKLLPFQEGGALVLSDSRDFEGDRELLARTSGTPIPFYEYDLYAVAQKRRQNAAALLDSLGQPDLPVQPLHREIPGCVIPQTFPVLISGANRDELYFRMNDLGYGVVTLYHTLIDALVPAFYPDSFAVSRSILNLPVHQDLDAPALRDMVSKLIEATIQLQKHSDVPVQTV